MVYKYTVYQGCLLAVDANLLAAFENSGVDGFIPCHESQLCDN